MNHLNEPGVMTGRAGLPLSSHTMRLAADNRHPRAKKRAQIRSCWCLTRHLWGVIDSTCLLMQSQVSNQHCSSVNKALRKKLVKHHPIIEGGVTQPQVRLVSPAISLPKDPYTSSDSPRHRGGAPREDQPAGQIAQKHCCNSHAQRPCILQLFHTSTQELHLPLDTLPAGTSDSISLLNAVLKVEDALDHIRLELVRQFSVLLEGNIGQVALLLFCQSDGSA